MNITIIRHSIRNRGGDKLILDYCRYLLDNGHTITYWTNEVNSSFDVDKRITLKMIPLKGVVGTILFTLKTKFPSDIVLVDLVIMSALAGLRNRKKVLLLAQDYDTMYYSFLPMRLLIKGIYWLALSIMKIPAIAVSDNLAQKLRKHGSGNIIAVSNGIDLEIFYKNDESTFRNHKTQPFTIMIYARSDYRKGFDLAIKALRELNKISQHRNWEIWTIGEDTLEAPIDNINIKRLGFLSPQNLRDALSTADIFLSPSRHEGFGLLQLQAAACECAIVTTDALAIFENEVNALKSPVENWEKLAANLNTVLNDEQLRKKLQKNARLLAEQYSLKNSCKRFDQSLNSLFNKRH